MALANSAGGQTTIPPSDVGASGRVAFVLDSNGALLGCARRASTRARGMSMRPGPLLGVKCTLRTPTRPSPSMEKCLIGAQAPWTHPGRRSLYDVQGRRRRDRRNHSASGGGPPTALASMVRHLRRRRGSRKGSSIQWDRSAAPDGYTYRKDSGVSGSCGSRFQCAFGHPGRVEAGLSGVCFGTGGKCLLGFRRSWVGWSAPENRVCD